jgi:molybdopterin synthase sulfur carrier subunit
VPTVRLLLFARAREAAGRRDDMVDAATLGDMLACVCDRYGPEFAEVLAASRVWINGDEPPEGDATALSDGDEVAVLPPVSGGGHEWGCDTLKSCSYHDQHADRHADRGECNATHPTPGRS